MKPRTDEIYKVKLVDKRNTKPKPQKKKKRHTGIEMGDKLYVPVSPERYDVEHVMDIDFLHECRNIQEMLYDSQSESFFMERIKKGYFIPTPTMLSPYSDLIDHYHFFDDLKQMHERIGENKLHRLFYSRDQLDTCEYYNGLLKYIRETYSAEYDFEENLTWLIKVIQANQKHRSESEVLWVLKDVISVKKCLVADFATITNDYKTPFIGFIDQIGVHGLLVKHPNVRNGKLIFIGNLSDSSFSFESDTIINWLNRKKTASIVGEEIWVSPSSLCHIIMNPQICKIDIDILKNI